MKIAILTSGILPIPAVRGGAVENHIDFYLKYNDEHQLHDMTVFSVSDKRTEGHPALNSKVNHYEYIEVDNLWARIIKHLHKKIHGNGYYHRSIEYYFRKAWKRLQKKHYDVILLDNRPGYATSMKVPEGTKLYIYLHNDLLNNKTKDYQQIYDAADRILTVSNYIANCVKTINPQDKKCIPVLNGIDINAFSPDIQPKVTREQLGFSENDFILVFSGRVSPEKGVKELINAIKRLHDLPDIKLLIIGSPFYGEAKNGKTYLGEVEQAAESIKDRIRFTGFIPYKDMPYYLRIADIAVIPSLWDDPCPNTVLEAQAMSLPIITTRRGGIPEEVAEDGAILLTTDDSFMDNLTESIRQLHDDPQKRKEMGEVAYKHSKYYNSERYAEDFFKALCE